MVTVDTDTLVVDATNNRVGIGTASPVSPLTTSIGAGSAGSLNNQIAMTHSGASNSYHIKTIRATANDEPAGLAFVENTTERMRIDSSGNVGIGVVPGVKLHVEGDTNSNVMVVNNIGTAPNYIFDVRDDGVSKLRVDPSGNLLVGTANDTPGLGDTDVGASFRADGASFVSRTLSDTSGSTLYVNRNTNDGNLVQFQKDGTTVGSIGAYNTVPYFAGPNANAGGFRIDSTGTNGVIMPTTNTGANRDAAIDLGYSSGGTNVRFRNLYLSGDLALTESFVFGNTDGLNLRANSGKVISMQIVGSEKARIDSSGNFLVGVSTFANNTLGVAIRGASSGATDESIRCAVPSTGSTLQIGFHNANGRVGSVSTSGSATAFNTSSDQRLKENIVDAPSASDDIDAIQVRSFDWKADGSHQKYGMVAQELQTVAPEAVYQPEDPEEMMGVDYSKLVPMMLKEIQSLRARVAELESK